MRLLHKVLLNLWLYSTRVLWGNGRMGTQDRVENIHNLISLSFHFAYSELWLILPTPATNLNNEIEKRCNYVSVKVTLICLVETGCWIFLHIRIPNFQFQTWVWKCKTTVKEEHFKKKFKLRESKLYNCCFKEVAGSICQDNLQLLSPL